MSKSDPTLGYDEDEAVRFIQSHLPKEIQEKFSYDDINYIIDVVYDYYEEMGFLEEPSSEESVVEINEGELLEYVLKAIRKDKINSFSEDEILQIIQGELDYCDSLNIFE